MKLLPFFSERRVMSSLPTLFCLVAMTAQALAALPARISGELNGSERTPIQGSLRPQARPEAESGRLASETRLNGITIEFNRTAAQEASLKALIAAQQNPASAQFHQWLTPEQFAARFGMSDGDLAKVQSWLEQQGFSIDSVNRSRNGIRFSGTAAQVERAFATEMHTYTVNGQKHFAPSTALSVPSGMASTVLAIRNLDDFRPRPHLIRNRNLRAKPRFTQAGTGAIFFAPGDIDVEYDINPLYNSGYNGTGQSITVVGQSEIAVSDIEAFQTAAGLTVKDPTVILMPGTGSAAFSSGDETESDLDLEWSGAIAQGATINLVYTGDNPNYGAFDALQYAIDNKIGNVISSSYGDCEADLGGYSLESSFEQATSQGQTLIAAAGDDGSTDCEENTDLTTAQEESLAVDYPGSSPYVTSVGGTEISQANSAYEDVPSAYWAGADSSDVITSVLQYIPEQAWNEDSICVTYVSLGGAPLCAGGGGASTLFTKPSWQTGVPGIPSDGHRDVPDIALNAAIYNPGYLLCTSDQSAWDTADGQVSSCTSGFEDATSGILTAAGGTSFAAPIFAGMVAILNQKQGYNTGQGLVNGTLYTLASNASTYASAFHDITTGNNDCDAGSSYCSGTIGFAAGTGYDQATGLGTIDLSELAGVWPQGSGGSLIGTTTTISATSTTPTVNSSDTFTVTVASETGSTIPTGTVSITVDSGTPITGNTLTANGTFTYTTSFATAGAHTVTASYSGDTTHAASNATISVTATGVSSGKGSFALSAGNITVSQGNSGSSTVTVTPAGGYTGTVLFNLAAPSNLTNACYVLDNAVVTGTTAATSTLTINTNGADCANSAEASKRGERKIRPAGVASSTGLGQLGEMAIVAGLLFAGLAGRRSKKLRVWSGVACAMLMVALGLAATGCGGGSGSNTVPNAPKGTYTMTLTGTDSQDGSIVATTTLTLTVN
jgi:subtilase family serine protease